MERVMKKLIGIVIVATTIVPAFAQSFDPDNGSGNLVPGNIVAAAPAPVHSRTISRHRGEGAYAMSVRRKVNSNPAYLDDNNTGGGSPGYNAMLRTW
jgi:hypothetical protein